MQNNQWGGGCTRKPSSLAKGSVSSPLASEDVESKHRVGSTCIVHKCLYGIGRHSLTNTTDCVHVHEINPRGWGAVLSRGNINYSTNVIVLHEIFGNGFLQNQNSVHIYLSQLT